MIKIGTRFELEFEKALLEGSDRHSSLVPGNRVNKHLLRRYTSYFHPRSALGLVSVKETRIFIGPSPETLNG
jgi:hypothetical protein